MIQLLKNLLAPNPKHRISAFNALYLPIFSRFHYKLKENGSKVLSKCGSIDKIDKSETGSEKHNDLKSLASLERRSFMIRKQGSHSDANSIGFDSDSPERRQDRSKLTNISSSPVKKSNFNPEFIGSPVKTIPPKRPLARASGFEKYTSSKSPSKKGSFREKSNQPDNTKTITPKLPLLSENRKQRKSETLSKGEGQ